MPSYSKDVVRARYTWEDPRVYGLPDTYAPLWLQ